MLLGHGPNKIFLVPNSCRETERNGDSISAAVTDDTIENNDACFNYFQTIWQVFWTFRYYMINTLYVHCR